MDTAKTNTLDARAWVLHETARNTGHPHNSPNGIDIGPIPPPAPASQPANRPARPRKSSAWRTARASVALLAVLALLWWLVVPLLFPVTSRAIVNARTVQVRSPGDGTSTELGSEVSDEVESGQTILRVSNPRVDTSHLSELKGKLSGLDAQQARSERELGECEAALPALRSTVERYQKAAMEGLSSAVKEVVARADSARIELEAAEQRHKRLTRSNAVTSIEKDALQEGVSRARKNLEKEEAAKARLEGEHAAARQGVFLQNEASYARKRVDETEEKIATLRSSLKENALLRAAASTLVREEEKRVAQLTGVDVVSPVSGTVWRRPGNLGQVVKQNELVYEIADRDSIFVEALFHQRYLSSAVAPGARAVVNLTSGQRLGGRVKAVRTLGEADAEACYAVNLAGSDVKHVRVMIELDGDCRDASLIGRHARVLIVGENPGTFDRGVAWLFTKLGG